MIFTKTKLDQLHSRFRANLINSATGYKTANLIATKSTDGITNITVFNSFVHLGANPPLIGFILRPTTVPRDTYKNIQETGFYTINHIVEEMIEDAHHTSAKYPEDVSEFDQTNLEEEYLEDFYPPFVKGSPVQMGVKFVDEHLIEQNQTRLIIGEIQFINIHENALQNDGSLDLTLNKTAAIVGLNGYAVPTQLRKLDYQKPK
jgi:flavin reductase (DIM6/NTAB) family NADH-FMN oxidoreductase RutF